MSSGFNGQNFTFNGYLPIEKRKRADKLKYFEKIVSSKKQTQIFIETPYRNNQIYESIYKHAQIKKIVHCLQFNFIQ